MKVKLFSRVRLFETPWTAAYLAPLSVGFSRQEYWSGVPSPSLSYIVNSPQSEQIIFQSFSVQTLLSSNISKVTFDGHGTIPWKVMDCPVNDGTI